MSSIEGLSGLKEQLVGLMAAPAVFGALPEGADAAARLAQAASDLIGNLEQAGISVGQIAENAGTVAEIAGATDAAAFIESLGAQRHSGGLQPELR